MRKLFMVACMVLSWMVVTPAAFAQQAVSATVINQFLANPAQVLAQYPNGGAALSALIAAVIEAHPDALQTVMNLVGSANSAQQQALGTGLADAANFFAAQPNGAGTAEAETILTAISDSGNATLIASAAASISPTAGGLVGTGTALAFAMTAYTTSTINSGQRSCVSPNRPGSC